MMTVSRNPANRLARCVAVILLTTLLLASWVAGNAVAQYGYTNTRCDNCLTYPCNGVNMCTSGVTARPRGVTGGVLDCYLMSEDCARFLDKLIYPCWYQTGTCGGTWAVPTT